MKPDTPIGAIKDGVTPSDDSDFLPMVNSLLTSIAYCHQQDGWDAILVWDYRIDHHFDALETIC